MSEPLRLSLSLTPHGHLRVALSRDAPELEGSFAARLEREFERGSGYGLLRLGGAGVGRLLPPDFGWWRDFGGRWLTALCTRA